MSITHYKISKNQFIAYSDRIEPRHFEMQIQKKESLPPPPVYAALNLEGWFRRARALACHLFRTCYGI